MNSNNAMISMVYGAALTLMTFGAHAQDLDPVATCYNESPTQVALGDCLQQALDRSEAELAATLAEVREYAGRVEGGQALTILDQGQAAWSAFRSADCKVPAALAAGSPGAAYLELACTINETRSRVDALRWLLPAT